MMSESMKLDISKIKFEEAYDNTQFEEFTLCFIAPRDLVKNKYPEAEHSTISLVIDLCPECREKFKKFMDIKLQGEEKNAENQLSGYC